MVKIYLENLDPAGPGWRYVYVVRTQDACKFGLARNIKRRLVALNCGSTQAIRYEAAVLATETVARRIEWACKRDMGDHLIRGEWFKITPNEAVRCLVRQARWELDRPRVGTLGSGSQSG